MLFAQTPFQNAHGWAWFHAAASSHCELVAQGCTGRTSLGVATIANLGGCVGGGYLRGNVLLYRHS